MLEDFLRLNRGFEQTPLLVSALIRTFLLSIWAMVFSVLEATVKGLIDRRGLMAGITQIADRGSDRIKTNRR